MLCRLFFVCLSLCEEEDDYERFRWAGGASRIPAVAWEEWESPADVLGHAGFPLEESDKLE